MKEEIEMSEIVKVGKKGQITLPKRIREKEGLKEGELLEIKDMGEGGIFAVKVDKKREIETAFRLMGKETDFTDSEEVVDYVREVRSEVFEEWKESS